MGERKRTVARCDVCGNEYDKTFRVVMADGREGTFDSFECAIHQFAPTCAHCGCGIIGHGVEADRRMFCCVHCARESGVTEVADRAGASEPSLPRTRPPAES